MTTQTSEQLKAELTNLFFGINSTTFAVESVTVTRGGTLTLRRAGEPPRAYRIRGGRPAYKEIARVFGLTNLVAMSPTSDLTQIATHPSMVALRRLAATSRERSGLRRSHGTPGGLDG
jgi:hypothetical protein